VEDGGRKEEFAEIELALPSIFPKAFFGPKQNFLKGTGIEFKKR